MDTDNEEEELYSHRLKEVFDSCDLDNKGYINRNEVIDLSQKLQCGDQVPELLRETLGDEFTDGKVTFQQFRDGFVNILAKTIDGLVDTTITDEVTDPSEFSEFTEFSFGDQCVPELERDAPFPSRIPTFVRGNRKTSTPIAKTKIRNEIEQLEISTKDEETSEGCGVINVFHQDCTSAQDTIICGKATQIRQIWDEIAVGQSGSINLLQLSTICEHIGMESMDGDDLELLFSELDTDGDGLVTLEEFLSGLFGADTPRTTEFESVFENDDEEKSIDQSTSSSSTRSPDTSSRGSRTSRNSRTSKRKRLPSVVANSPVRLNLSEEVHSTLIIPGGDIFKKGMSLMLNGFSQKFKATEILSSLDLDNTGCAKLEDIRSYLSKYEVENIDFILKDVSVDADGRVELKQLAKHFERIVLDCGNALSKVVVLTFKEEVTNLRGRLESTNNEVNVLKNNLSKLETNHNSFIIEGEDQLRKEKDKHDQKYRQLEKSFQTKLIVKEKGWEKEKEKALDVHREEVIILESQFEQMRTDLIKTKEKLQEAITDNERMENDIRSYSDELNLERKKFIRVEKELASCKNLKEKVTDLELQLAGLSQVRYEESNRVKELERMTKELRDQNDEYVARLEARIDDDRSDNSSYLSEYFKSDINELRDSYDDNRHEQDKNISSLHRDLATVNRLLEDNDSIPSDRFSREINYITNKYESEIADLHAIMERERKQLNELHTEEKENMIDTYEAKIAELRKHLFYENRGIEENGMYGSKGIEEVEESYKLQLSKLEEKLLKLETEKAEMELNFLNQKAELEQSFRIERAELEQNASSTNREMDRSKKYIDFLKDDLSKKHIEFIEEMQRVNRKEKQESQERHHADVEELKLKHQKDIIEIRKSFNHQITELEKTFSKERSSLKEGFLREKSEMEQKFLRERVELEDFLKQEYELEIANKLADYQKMSVEERTEMEEKLREEKYELSISLQHQKANGERNLRHLKTEMEMTFTEEKNQLMKDFEYEKNMLQSKYKREIAELQSAFSGGEAGLKGKMKDDFTRLIEQRRKEWQESFEREKTELLQSFAREKGELESSWTNEKYRMEHNYDEERKELEHMFECEKQELIDRFQKQRQNMEEEFLEENRKLKESKEVEISTRIERETGLLKQNMDHLETELLSLRQQKKELETRNQILELKQLSQQQEATEIATFQNEKQQITHKITILTNEVSESQKEKETLQSELDEMSREKTTILDNSVMEITQQQEQIAHLQAEKEELETRVDELRFLENENDSLKQSVARLTKDSSEKKRVLQSYAEVEKVNESLSEKNRLLTMTVGTIEDRERQVQNNLLERTSKISRLEEEVNHYVGKLDALESVHMKEMDAQKERFNLQYSNANEEKVKHLDEIKALKKQLLDANALSDRDAALKTKVFNDAKAEVISLNKKLEEKSRKIRELEEKVKNTNEQHKYKSSEDFHHLEGQMKSLKTIMSDKDTKTREERNSLLTKSIRSDNLVTDLYLENADLMKQIANAENMQSKAEKQVRQLTDQKRALQRVISKLCHANGISNHETGN